MKTVTHIMLAFTLVLPLAACDMKADEAPKEVVKPPMAAPTSEDSAAWRDYVTDVVGRNMEGVSNQPFVYLLPAESTTDFEGSYDRLLEKAENDILRGILPGNLLTYAAASPSSTKAADMAAAAFAGAKPGKMKGVKVLFIGKVEDSDRVKAAVEPSGATYAFVEAK